MQKRVIKQESHHIRLHSNDSEDNEASPVMLNKYSAAINNIFLNKMTTISSEADLEPQGERNSIFDAKKIHHS